MTDTQHGIFEAEATPLPKTTLVTITEAITFLACGDARDSIYLKREHDRQCLANKKKWGHNGGASTLLYWLPKLIQNRGLPNGGVKNWSEVCNEVEARRIREWMDSTNFTDPYEALAEARASVSKNPFFDFYKDIDHEKIEAMVFDHCLSGKVQLHGLMRDSETGLYLPYHTTIPVEFFMQPVAVGMLSEQIIPYDTNEQLALDELLHASPERPSYSQVKIKRVDVENLLAEMKMTEAIVLTACKNLITNAPTQAKHRKAIWGAMGELYPQSLPEITNVAFKSAILKRLGDDSKAAEWDDKTFDAPIALLKAELKKK